MFTKKKRLLKHHPPFPKSLVLAVAFAFNRAISAAKKPRTVLEYVQYCAGMYACAKTVPTVVVKHNCHFSSQASVALTSFVPHSSAACVDRPHLHLPMTIRAFLRLSDDLRDAFSRAQHDGSLRYLRVEVVAGNALTVVGSGSRGSSLEVDFDSLSQVSKRRACLVLSIFPCGVQSTATSWWKTNFRLRTMVEV